MRVSGATLPLIALLAACGGEGPLAPDSGVEIGKPLFDHWAPPPEPIVTVDVNNYVLSLAPAELRTSWYNGVPVLFAGGVTYGNAPDAVFVYDTRGVRAPGFTESGLPVEVTSSLADHHTVSLLIETPDGGRSSESAVPLGLGVVRETFAFAGDDYVILKYTLFNPTPATVAGLYLGEIHDMDIGSWVTENLVEYVSAEDLVRVTSGGTSSVGGHVLLSSSVSSYRGWTNQAGVDGDPQDLAEWFHYLSGGIIRPDQPFGPQDIRHLLATGPVDVGDDDAVVLVTALVGGDGATALSAHVEDARSTFGDLASLQALEPYPMAQVEVAVVGGTLDLTAPGSFDVAFTFQDQAQAALAAGGNVVYASTPATMVAVAGAVVTATFQKADVPAFDPSDRQPWKTGDRVTGAGKLTDGTLYWGFDFPDIVPESPPPPAPVTRLTFNQADDRAPSWSPDGTSIVFSSNRKDGEKYNIWRMEIAAGEQSAVRLTGGSNELAPDWDGESTIVFGRQVGPDFKIFSIAAAGGKKETLLTSDGRNPRVSPDGSLVAFVRGTTIWMMPATGETNREPAVQLTFGNVSSLVEYQPAWSADNIGVYFAALQEGIFRVDLPGGDPTRVTPIESINRHPAISPDGATLAFVSNIRSPLFTYGIVLQDLQTGHHTVLELDPPVEVSIFGSETRQNLEFSPDGMKLLFAAGPIGRQDIYVADISALVSP